MGDIMQTIQDEMEEEMEAKTETGIMVTGHETAVAMDVLERTITSIQTTRTNDVRGLVAAVLAAAV